MEGRIGCAIDNGTLLMAIGSDGIVLDPPVEPGTVFVCNTTSPGFAKVDRCSSYGLCVNALNRQILGATTVVGKLRGFVEHDSTVLYAGT